jgi:hypothetical protein
MNFHDKNRAKSIADVENAQKQAEKERALANWLALSEKITIKVPLKQILKDKAVGRA